MLLKRLRRGRAFCRDHAFERREPMAVVGFSGIGIAGRLRFLDFLTKHRGPFGPGKETFFVQRQRHRKRMGFPGCAEDWAILVAGNARKRFRCAPGGFRFNDDDSDMFEVRLKRFDGDFQLWVRFRTP